MVGDRFWFLARFAFGPEWDIVSMPAALCCGVCASLICYWRPKPRVSFPSSLVQSIPLWSSVQFPCYHLSIFPGCQCPSLVPQWRIQPSSVSHCHLSGAQQGIPMSLFLFLSALLLDAFSLCFKAVLYWTHTNLWMLACCQLALGSADCYWSDLNVW